MQYNAIYYNIMHCIMPILHCIMRFPVLSGLVMVPLDNI